MIGGSAATELASQRTTLAFHRTVVAMDRILMAIVRTSLSLISFGFTIYKVFSNAHLKGVLEDADQTARRLGLALLVIGICYLAAGMWGHSAQAVDLRTRHTSLVAMNLMHPEAKAYRTTSTVVLAAALLVVALLTLASIAFRLFA